MVRIRTLGRSGTARAARAAPEAAPPPSRALVALEGRRDDARRSEATRDARGRPLAGFLAQMIADADPTLRPSRLDRTRAAAARYVEAARLADRAAVRPRST